MKSNRIDLSIVIVNYKVEKELLDCISSITDSRPKISCEIIVVDNDADSKLENTLKSKFSSIKYVKSPNNIGYGGGNNLGASCAHGEYLFFLNPDTKILGKTLDNLYSFFVANNNTGIISPVFLDDNLKPFKSQGSKELTPKTILFSQSFLRKIFPSKNIYNNNTLNNWDMKNPIMVDAVSGAAMMISSNLFRKIGGFDENFFLYFEENDISKRIKNLGYKLFIVPSAKIIHLLGRSTKTLKDMDDVFSKSRYLYLKKHYGVLKAIFTQAILSINKTSILLLLILLIAFILRVLNLENTMPFIGDQGWFYLSARDMVLKGQIPLVGIASSHPWLHQGPLWTYMLAGVFWLFGFNPINGAYLTIMLGILTILLIYILGHKMFSKKVGLISALLYATSPLAIVHSRTPYHTSPIPLFTLLFIYSIYKFIKGEGKFFPLSVLFLSILYNLELATATLWGVLFIVLGYGMWKRKEWLKKIWNKKSLVYSFFAFLIPMAPILIYDFNNNFPQTLKFIAWTGYRMLIFFGFPSIHGESQSVNIVSMLEFSFNFYQNLIFTASGIVAFVIFIFSFSLLIANIYRSYKKKMYNLGILLLALWIVISLLGYFVNKTPSEAYLPILFPGLILLTVFSFEKIMKIEFLFIPIALIAILMALINSYVFLLESYSKNGRGYFKRLTIAKEIVMDADGRQYNIIGEGNGSQFESFTMNYEYLTWWLGHAPSKSSQKVKYVVKEDGNGILLTK